MRLAPCHAWLLDKLHLSYSLNSLRRGEGYGVIKGDTRSLDNGSFLAGFQSKLCDLLSPRVIGFRV